MYRSELNKMRLVILAALLVVTSIHAAASDWMDPNANIMIRWDIRSWTPDGYVATVTMSNFQMYRQVSSPGWTLGRTWTKQEVIWALVGAQTTEQGDCSKFKGNIPHCCLKNPSVIDLLPGVPYNQQYKHCCKGGVMASQGQDPAASVSAFQISVGLSGTSKKTVKLPENVTLLGPGPGYTCSKAKIAQSTKFLSPDGRRRTQALMTWDVECTYSQLLASNTRKCCVSLSSFYNPTITSCPTCACGCSQSQDCINGDTLLTTNPRKDYAQPLQCTDHMCPIRVHWHVKKNHRRYWLVKITISNFNYGMNYTQWTLVMQHPNLNNITKVFNFDYRPLMNDMAMFFGVKYHNDMIVEAGPLGFVQSNMLLQKDREVFTLNQGWAFPRKVYFNGDECAMPPPDVYPYLPSLGDLGCRAMVPLVVASVFLHMYLLLIG